MDIWNSKLIPLARAVWSLIGLGTALAYPDICYAESIESKKLCATTPTYKYFEDLQYDAYSQNPIFFEMLRELRSTENILKTLAKVEGELNKRQNSLGRQGNDTKDVNTFISNSLKDLQLPTCYENPAIFLMLTEYAKQIEAARSALNLELTSEVNLATLPTAEVNAHTYPAFGGIGNVLAFNIQLFMFDYQMTKSVISTIGLERKGNSIAVDPSPQTAFRKMQENDEISTDFSMALLEFIGLVSPSTRPIDQSFDSLLIKFTTGMELFAVAHEYGHVIKRHKSPTTTMPLGLDADGEPKRDGRNVAVLARSWQQELEADQVGIRLVLQALRSQAKSGANEDLSWLYSAKGALFFFRCLEIVDEAKLVKSNKRLPPPPIFAERVFLRAFADGKSSSADNDTYKSLTMSDYPPAWLRLERVQATIEAEIASVAPSGDSIAFSKIADGIIENAPLVWRTVSSRFPVLIEAIRRQKMTNKDLSSSELAELKAQADAVSQPRSDAAFPPGCYVKAGSWPTTFLCNPALQEAIVTFEAGTADDAAYVRLYHAAFDRDWLLLAGIQTAWAEAVLSRADTNFRRDALAILALSGNRASSTFLDTLDLTSWSETDRKLFERAKLFASQYGRDLSMARLAATEPATFHAAEFLSAPGNMTDLAENAIPQKTSYETEVFLARHGGVAPGGPVSGLMLALLHKRWSPGKIDSALAEMLEAVGSKDAALKFASHGVAVGGPLAALENTIGTILTAKQEYEEANIHYTASLMAGRNDGWPELNIANNLDRLGQDDQAEIMYRRALGRRANARSETEFAEYLNDTAWFLSTKRSGDNAMLKEALALSLESNQIVRNNNPNYLDTLAECQFKLGDTSSAVKTSEAALALIPSNDAEQHKKFSDRLAIFKRVGQSPAQSPAPVDTGTERAK